MALYPELLSDITSRGYDSPDVMPGEIYAAPIEVTGDMPELDAYLANNGVSRVAFITRDARVSKFWTIMPKPESDTPLANNLRSVKEKEGSGEIEHGSYTRLLNSIIDKALLQFPGQTE